MPFKQGELRREASSRRNAKTEAFRAGESVKRNGFRYESTREQSGRKHKEPRWNYEAESGEIYTYSEVRET